MMLEKGLGRRWGLMCVTVLACLMSVKAGATQKTVPIVFSVEVADTVLAPWTLEQREQTPAKMLELFEEAVAPYFGTWWEVLSEHRMQTRLTLALVFAKGGPREHYFEVELRVGRKWADGSVTEDNHILAKRLWRDPVGTATAPTTPTNVLAALPAFLECEFPNDAIKKKSVLLDVMDYTPVAVEARPLDDGANAVVLPFPKTSRWMCFQHRLFKLLSDDRYRGLPALIVKAKDEWQEPAPNSVEGLIATVEAVSANPDAGDYDQAHIYLSNEDSGWDTIL